VVVVGVVGVDLGVVFFGDFAFGVGTYFSFKSQALSVTKIS